MERDTRPDNRDPFPTLSHAKRHLWRAIDFWAFRRMQRLGMPTPWMAYEMGRADAIREMNYREIERKASEIHRREIHESLLMPANRKKEG